MLDSISVSLYERTLLTQKSSPKSSSVLETALRGTTIVYRPASCGTSFAHFLLNFSRLYSPFLVIAFHAMNVCPFGFLRSLPEILISIVSMFSVFCTLFSTIVLYLLLFIVSLGLRGWGRGEGVYCEFFTCSCVPFTIMIGFALFGVLYVLFLHVHTLFIICSQFYCLHFVHILFTISVLTLCSQKCYNLFTITKFTDYLQFGRTCQGLSPLPLTRCFGLLLVVAVDVFGVGFGVCFGFVVLALYLFAIKFYVFIVDPVLCADVLYIS